MTWEIALGIITFFGFVVSVVTPITKLTKIMTELSVSVGNLKNSIDQINSKNTESHRRIWEHNEEQDEKIEDHEKRITRMEYDIDKYHHDPNYHGHYHKHVEDKNN